MGWRDFQTPPHMDKMDNMDNMTESEPLNTYYPLNPPIEVTEKPARADGRDLPHYCEAGDCHCSSKLPGNGYPLECIRTNCEHYLRPESCYCGSTEFRDGIDGWRVCNKCQVPERSIVKHIQRTNH